MSTLSDVQALYGSMRETWTKSQPHILTHAVAGIVVFGICRVTWLEFDIPQVDPKQITENDWFKLAKETGLVYVLLVLPIIAMSVYGQLLRISGRILTTVLMMIFQPRPGPDRPDLLSAAALVPLALTLKKEDFDLSDLMEKAGEMAWKYQTKKVEAWTAMQKKIVELTKDSPVYLGDFLTFSVAWMILFQSMSSAAWTQANRSSFLPVLLIFLALAWFAWFRVSRAMAALPNLYLISVSGMLASDPDTSPLLAASHEEQARVIQRLEELLKEKPDRPENGPSLRRFLRYQLGLSARNPVRRKPKRVSLSAALYELGKEFEWEEKLHENYDDHWFGGYLTYLYYRFYRWLSMTRQTVWQLIRYLVTGTP